MNKKVNFHQKVVCHKARVGACRKDSDKSIIIFDEQGFPWCAEHFPADRLTNLGTKPAKAFGAKAWSKRKQEAASE